MGSQYNFALQFGAIAVTVWAAGIGPATLAIILGYIVSNALFIEPRGHFAVSNIADLFGLISYVISSSLIVTIGEALRRARAAAKHDHDSLNLALEAANMNTFDVDLDGKTTSRSENAARFYGLSPNDYSRGAFLDNLHPEDRQRHLDAIEESRTTGKEYFSRYRFIRPHDKRMMWVESHGKVILDKAGRARFVGTSLNVTEKVLLEQRLADQAKTLALRSQRKSDFIVTLAHELRNPLAPIKTCIQLLKHSQANEQAKDSALQIVERQTQRIESLIEDLVDVSRIERGRITLRFERLDLGIIISKATEASKPHLDAKFQRLSVRMPDGPMFVKGDEGRIIQVVSNLLNNSSKFAVENGAISITGLKEGDHALVSVKDDGIGIAPENLKAIFELYFQTGQAVSYSNPGLGLGLTLCKSLVEMHGGTIEAKSEGLGKGSEFVFRLPLASEQQTNPARSALESH